MIGKPAANLRRITLQPLDAFGFLRRQIGLQRLRIGFTVSREHRLRRRFELRGLTLELRARAALGLRCIARQFHPIDREHLAPDQALPVADEEHLAKDARHLVPERADEPGQRGEVRRRVAAQGDEGDVLATSAFDAAAADDALRISKQDHLEQHRRRVGAGTGLIVIEARIPSG